MSTKFLESTNKGILLEFDAGPFVVDQHATITNTNSVLSAAIEIDFISGASLTNFGTIEGAFEGIYGEISESIIHNQRGTISGLETGLQLFGSGNTIVNATFSEISGETAIRNTGFGSAILNSGEIVGDINGVGIVDDGEENYILNRGTIFGGTAIVVESEDVEIVNWQSITGRGVGINFHVDSVGGVVQNNGFLSGGGDVRSIAVMGNDTAQKVVNNATIEGKVRLEGGHDLFDGRNGDAADVRGGEGNDTLLGGDSFDRLFGNAGDDSISGGGREDLLSGGDGNDTLDGGEGDDRLFGLNDDDLMFGGAGNDEMVGGLGNDTMSGQSGQDTLFGRKGNDSLSGGQDNDTLFGDTGNDTLRGDEGNDSVAGGSGQDLILGGAGADILQGESGNDTLDGGSGNDLIDGGTGRDVMRGGEGSDVFDFNTLRDSAVAISRTDVILDFERGQDKVDIGDLNDAGMFTLVEGFTGSGSAEFRIAIDATRGSHVLIDADGDGRADTAFLVEDVFNLSTGDFVL
ncbi:calcium-binding protein [uncultured Tateyamaria sp.]|uniref:calcium-binding protein n=1 Tax=uncultured Tateyamaria sp. TaxID=455651 RepID=UPI002601FD5D|nr:calcium-binding protein [uncultured Tateyamaria sp.]